MSHWDMLLLMQRLPKTDPFGMFASTSRPMFVPIIMSDPFAHARLPLWIILRGRQQIPNDIDEDN